MFPEIWKPKTMYNMIPYKSKMVHAEEYIINFSPIIHKKSHPRKENNYGDDSIMFILDDKHLGDIIIAGNTYLRGNRIL